LSNKVLYNEQISAGYRTTKYSIKRREHRNTRYSTIAGNSDESRGSVMINFLQNLAGMGGMTDQVIATDFLISTKSGIRNLAFAITETKTPELKAALREQLRVTVERHEEISNYMIAKGYYHPHDLSEQLQVDLNTANTALNLSQQ